MKIKAVVIAALLLLAPLSAGASIGVKAGFNFANVTNASSINASSQTGFMAGVFMGPPSGVLLGFQSELVFSRQGYDFKTNQTTGSVKLDYLLLPQLLTLNFANIVRAQAGFQLSYLLKAKVEGAATGDPETDKLLDLFNRLDYGLAGGVEVSPFMGFLVGARINISFGKLYKEVAEPPSFFPSVNAKNNVFQIYGGYRF